METSRGLDCAMLLSGSFATWRLTAVAADDTTGTDNAATVSRPPLACEVSAYELAPHLRASGDRCWTREEAMSVLAGRVTAARRRRELGVCYYRARCFSAQLGTFVSRDPIAYTDCISLVEYVWDSPTNRTDPAGLQTLEDMEDYPSHWIPAERIMGGYRLVPWYPRDIWESFHQPEPVPPVEDGGLCGRAEWGVAVTLDNIDYWGAGDLIWAAQSVPRSMAKRGGDTSRPVDQCSIISATNLA